MPSTLNKRKKALPPQSKKRIKISSYLISSGLFLAGLGTVIFFLTFYPVIKEEVGYQISQTILKKVIKKNINPVDSQFGIVIPKIGANAVVVVNVDPFNAKEYQWALTKGVAQARGTVFPGQTGNIFIFAHSSGNWYQANRYNSIFYLLHKLVKDDIIYLYYKNKEFKYTVSDAKIVEASEVKYLTGTGEGKTLNLMTCWPPGTTLKRYLVTAEFVLH